MRALAVVLFVACTPMQRTTALALSSSAMIAVDWNQSLWITRSCVEGNPIIGVCGERVPVNMYFPVALALNLTIGLVLSEHWRELWFAAVTGAQASTVWSNRH